MPYKTKYGSHYHMEEGCHGATIPCDTNGLEPCSDCCGTKGDGGAAGGSSGGSAGGAPTGGFGESASYEVPQDGGATSDGPSSVDEEQETTIKLSDGSSVVSGPDGIRYIIDADGVTSLAWGNEKVEELSDGSLVLGKQGYNTTLLEDGNMAVADEDGYVCFIRDGKDNTWAIAPYGATIATGSNGKPRLETPPPMDEETRRAVEERIAAHSARGPFGPPQEKSIRQHGRAFISSMLGRIASLGLPVEDALNVQSRASAALADLKTRRTAVRRGQFLTGLAKRVLSGRARLTAPLITGVRRMPMKKIMPRLRLNAIGRANETNGNRVLRQIMRQYGCDRREADAVRAVRRETDLHDRQNNVEAYIRSREGRPIPGGKGRRYTREGLVRAGITAAVRQETQAYGKDVLDDADLTTDESIFLAREIRTRLEENGYADKIDEELISKIRSEQGLAEGEETVLTLALRSAMVASNYRKNIAPNRAREAERRRLAQSRPNTRRPPRRPGTEENQPQGQSQTNTRRPPRRPGTEEELQGQPQPNMRRPPRRPGTEEEPQGQSRPNTRRPPRRPGTEEEPQQSQSRPNMRRPPRRPGTEEEPQGQSRPNTRRPPRRPGTETA